MVCKAFSKLHLYRWFLIETYLYNANFLATKLRKLNDVQWPLLININFTQVHNVTEGDFLIDSGIKEHCLHRQRNDSDTDSVEIIEFGETFSPYKSQLDRAFEEEVCK